MARRTWTREPWLVLGFMVSWATLTWAQTPMNWTNATSSLQNQYTVELTLTMSGGVQDTNVSLLPLTGPTLNNSIQGYTLPVNYTNTDSVTDQYIVYISCDPSGTYIPPSTVLAQAVAKTPRMVILYSLTSDYCALSGGPDYPYIYSIKSASDIQVLLASFARYSKGNPQLAWTYVKPLNGTNLKADEATGTTDSGNGSGSGASPTTKIAMIILYTITGVITFLFLAVIITGAVRAHRHPERYGLRPGPGRPRRSRAHGLARAMLDSLPIVKFGERDDAQPKPTEVELGNTAHGPVEVVAAPSSAGPPPDPRSVPAHEPGTAKSPPHVDSVSPPPATPSDPAPGAPDSGIAPATSVAPPESESDTQGCSICTDDFERGQDQRVLPCNHRFHPACVDPWLLNVSGTCPLCRIDLHPRSDSLDSTRDPDAHDGARGDGEGAMAPPLGLHGHDGGGDDDDPSARRRLRIRRSIMIGLMGVGGRGPETMSRDERMQGLRALRRQQAQRRRREAQEDVAATADEERRLGSRLRAVFRPRRERNPETGGEGVAGRTIPENEGV